MSDYDRACAYIEDAAKLGSRPGLERISGLLLRLGDPQDDLRFIHIAGTNGKGSTACFIASALSEAGLRVGMYSSPAVCGIRDHYRINGELISESRYASCVSRVAAANEELTADKGDGATQFELETAVAFTFFKDEQCDVVLLECGMGGRDDATNIVKNKICCVITSVSYDHMQYLGDTLAGIADNKAGIITGDFPVIALDSGREVLDVIKKRCDETGSRLYVVSKDGIKSKDAFPLGQSISYDEFSDVTVTMIGTFQKDNAATALRTLAVIRDLDLIGGCTLGEDVIRRGLKRAKWPYRMELINADPLILTDGAHNADAACRLRESIGLCLDGYRVLLIMGMFSDKEYEKVVATLAGIADMIFTVETKGNPRALPAGELAKCARSFTDKATACGSVREAYDLAVRATQEYKDKGEKAAVVACGSLSYLDELTRIVLDDNAADDRL